MPLVSGRVSTCSRFTMLVGIPERTYRRWQARARNGLAPRGPWPTPSQDQSEQVLVELADRWPAEHRSGVDSSHVGPFGSRTHRLRVDRGFGRPS